jgi:hypothetical protein
LVRVRGDEFWTQEITYFGFLGDFWGSVMAGKISGKLANFRFETLKFSILINKHF